MDRKGGCCLANYDDQKKIYGMSKVDWIMQKFRPIAPKPVANGSSSGGSATENGGFVKSTRRKRRYVRVNKNNNSKPQKTKVKSSSSSSSPPVVTLPLLPETPDLLSPAPAPPPPPPRLRKVVSYVTVESVTETWVDWEPALRCNDEEIVMNMENDSCPGFISDDQDTVVWTNKAYRRMGNVIDDEEAMAVVLVRKDEPRRPEVVTFTYPAAFTCKVKVTFAAADSHRKTPSPTLTLPCDVWRMDGGSYAWRLDVKAALSLGR